VDGRRISEQLENQTPLFIVLYCVVFLITALVLSLMDLDAMTSFSASIATLGNVGPGFSTVSSLANFASIPEAGKYMLSINMLLGRLEILNILALVTLKR
jgi:trk system potassium uptake protein TrkH